MWRIVESRRGVFVERPANLRARVAGGVLGLLWALVLFSLVYDEGPTQLLVAVVAILGVLMFVWLDRAGYSFKRYRVKALDELRDVPEGTLVVVRDTHNARHEVITTPANAASIRNAVWGAAD